MSLNALAYLEKHQNRFVAELKEWLEIPSISTLPEHSGDIQTAAQWVLGKLAHIGFHSMVLIQTKGHPLVYAEWVVDSSKPTVLLYGHYDVQPVDPVEEWDTPPFSPTERNGNLYARGAADDKGQVMLALCALEALAQTDGLPVNVKVLLEGEEEAGGEAVEAYVKERPDLLKADAALICDTHMLGETQPSLVTGLRGIIYTEVVVNGAKGDLHSGTYGGVAPNPIHALCVLIARLKGEDGVIDIPALQDAVPEASTQERQFWQDDPLKMADKLALEMGVSQLVGEDRPALERIGARPTLEVHGIRGGFTAEGAKTVIPATATAKISLRLPAGIDPQDAFTWFEEAVATHMPAGHAFRVKNLHGGRGMVVQPENTYIQAAVAALQETYGVEQPVLMREGGSIPIAALFDDVLGVPVVLMGFGLPDDGLHAPNEKFSLAQYEKGMRTVVSFLKRLAAEA